MTTMTMLDAYRAARQVSTPLIAVLTSDPAETIRRLVAEGEPALEWDAVRGLTVLTPNAQPLLTEMAPDGMPLVNLVEVLDRAARLPGDATLFLHQAHRQMDKGGVAQALWNLRDPFKRDGRAVILLAPSLTLPPDLASDVLVLDEPLPDDGALRDIIVEAHAAAGVESSTPIIDKAVDAIRGLAAFPAEQIVSMSLLSGTLDLEALWERNRKMIEQTPGLSVERAPKTFDAMGGLDNVKRFGSLLFQNPQRRPRVIVRLEEIEKMMAGAQGDNTGIAQDQLGVILQEMEDEDWTGLIAVGPAGAGKSLFSKALGAEGGVPTLKLDLGAAKQKHVGESEGRIRAIMKVIKAVAGPGGAFFVATCNRLEGLPPEFKRRFRCGTWFFDLPSTLEKAHIWGIMLREYSLPEQPLPEDKDWTGAEIRNCADWAARTQCSLIEAAQFIVPVAKSDPEALTRLRALATGRFLSASTPGVYGTAPVAAAVPPATPTRRISRQA